VFGQNPAGKHFEHTIVWSSSLCDTGLHAHSNASADDDGRIDTSDKLSDSQPSLKLPCLFPSVAGLMQGVAWVL